MPRNYFCDFCQCTFPDNPANRKSHNEGVVHINNRKLHYDWYKDPNEFLQEQMNRPPCRFYQQQGYCEFQLLCRYSHITYDPYSGQPILPPELIQWLQSHEKQPKPKKIKRPRLPAGWKIKELPPSLKPPFDVDYDWHHVGTWG
ncbi:hypothetical protein BD560DRAFT_393315 [Blakeslea trispora]|nr:hypothetical protein BD560DRAFT_393315 [Blakeslea trispora]